VLRFRRARAVAHREQLAQPLSLHDYLRKHGIPGISEIDTRALTKKLRVDGAMKCCLSTLPISDAEAVARARAWQDMAGADYVKDVTCPRSPILWRADDPANFNAPYCRSAPR
jgi:carbamoyl-phosphate synthase small subunit